MRGHTDAALNFRTRDRRKQRKRRSKDFANAADSLSVEISTLLCAEKEDLHSCRSASLCLAFGVLSHYLPKPARLDMEQKKSSLRSFPMKHRLRKGGQLDFFQLNHPTLPLPLHLGHSTFPSSMHTSHFKLPYPPPPLQ